MMTPKTPPGFNELLPNEQLAFDAILESIRSTYEQHGFTPLETPALELASLLLAKEGGETAKQVYRFNKGDSDLALRFDLTVPLARYVSEHYHELVFPFRRYQIQEVWRAEKPQAGRYRQFYQCDVDIVGSTDVTADAEVILAAADAYTSLGLTNVVFKLSHRGIIAGWLQEKKLARLTTDVLRTIDKLDKQSRKEIEQELIKIGLKKQDSLDLLELVSFTGSPKEIIAKLKTYPINNPLFSEAINRLTELSKLLTAGGMKPRQFVFDLKIARGLDYYTGIVFEMILPGKINTSVGAGGRYDNLVGQYRKEALPGVGASIGVSRLFSVLKNNLQTPATPTEALIVVFNENLLPYCFKVATVLRKGNINVEIYSKTEKLGKQLNYANKLNIPYVLLCGEEEEKKGQVTVKNMKSGKQEKVKMERVIKIIQK